MPVVPERHPSHAPPAPLLCADDLPHALNCSRRGPPGRRRGAGRAGPRSASGWPGPRSAAPRSRRRRGSGASKLRQSAVDHRRSPGLAPMRIVPIWWLPCLASASTAAARPPGGVRRRAGRGGCGRARPRARRARGPPRRRRPSEKRRSIRSRGRPSRSVALPRVRRLSGSRQLLGVVLEPVAPGRVAEEEPRQPQLRDAGSSRGSQGAKPSVRGESRSTFARCAPRR